jgi:hypothetical protein
VSYDGCRAWKNSDDGFDAFGGGGYISYNNSWAFENGPWKGGDEKGNGAGIKTGAVTRSGAEAGVQRTITRSLIWDNKGIGLDKSQDGYTGVAHNIYNNVLYGNNTAFNFWDSGQTDNIKNNIAYNNSYLTTTGGNFGPDDVVSSNSWNGFTVSSSDFLSLDFSQAKGARQADGSLPNLNFLKLSSTSKLINAGVNIGLPYNGSAPDLGAYEY